MTRTNALVVLIVFLVAAAGLADYLGFHLAHRISSDERSNTAALCAFRSDLQNRVTQGNAFLLAHPHGWLGISAPTIRQSLTGQESTLLALKPVRCPAN